MVLKNNFQFSFFLCRDFESDELVCDCRLQWMVKWQKTSKTRVLESTKCALPSELEGTAVRTLKRKDLHCGMFNNPYNHFLTVSF